METRKRAKGGILALIGYVLSPLSWWNDLYVNIPIAYVFAMAVSFVDKSVFTSALIIGYWITNVAGLVLMHRGVDKMFAGDAKERSSRRSQILSDVFISLLYTVLVLILLRVGWIKPLDLESVKDWLS